MGQRRFWPGRLPGLFTRHERARTPVQLLRADQEVVAFRGARRERLRRELVSWCVNEHGPRIDVRIIVAPGGQGKTRLATRLIANLRRVRGACAGFVDAGASLRAIARLASARRLVLLVVDHAEFRADQLDALVAAAARGEGRVRLLLLARSDGDWRSALAARSPELHDLVVGCPVIALEPVETTAEGRAAAWLEAVTDLAEGLATLPMDRTVDWPRVARLVTAPPDLHADRYASMLALHMHALASLLNAVHPMDQEATAEDSLLAHEERYWSETAAARPHRLDLSPRTLRLAVTAATVFGAATRDEALAVAGALPGIGEHEHAVVAEWLATLYPTRDRFWGPLLPHLLGEHLAATVLIAQTDALNGPASCATATQWTHALDTLARASVNYPLTPAITHLLGVAPSTAGPAATSVATAAQRPQPLVDALTMLADTADVELMMTLRDATPPDTVSLHEFTGHVLASLVTRLRPLAMAQPETMPALAASLTSLSGHLGGGEWGLAAMEEAVTTYRLLARARPDAFLPDFAASLNDLGDRLTELGRRDQAVATIGECVSTYRALAQTRPAFRSDLATSLNSFSASLAGLGRRDEALAAMDEALGIRRALANARPRPVWTVSCP